MRWIKKNVHFLAATLGVCCFLEIFFRLTAGTNPNGRFPWGHYEPTLAVLGAIFLVIAWFTRMPRPDLGPSAAPEGIRMPRERKRRRH